MSPQEFRIQVGDHNGQSSQLRVRMLFPDNYYVSLSGVKVGARSHINSPGGYGAQRGFDSFVQRYQTLRCILYQCILRVLPGDITRVLQVYAIQGFSGELTGLVHRGGVVALTNDVLMGSRVVVVS